MNMRLLRHLLGRTLRGKRLLGAAALASIAGVAAWVATAGESPAIARETFHVISATVPAATLSIAVLILTTATLRDERDGGTLPYVYLTPIRATTFATSAWAAATIAAVTVAVAGWLPAWVGTGLTTADWTLALPALPLYVGAAAGYAALFVSLGYLFDRSLIAGLGYIFVWEGILASVVAGIAPSSIWRIAMSIYADVVDLPRDALDVLGSVAPGAGGAAATLAVMMAAGVGILTWAVRTRDAV